MMMANTAGRPPAVTVLVAAYNETPVIGGVVRDALRAVPAAEVLVVDDDSRMALSAPPPTPAHACCDCRLMPARGRRCGAA